MLANLAAKKAVDSATVTEVSPSAQACVNSFRSLVVEILLPAYNLDVDASPEAQQDRARHISGGACTAAAAAGISRKAQQQRRVLRALLLAMNLDAEYVPQGDECGVGSPMVLDCNWLEQIHARLSALVPDAVWKLYQDDALSSEELLILSSLDSRKEAALPPVMVAHRQRGRLPIAMVTLSKLVLQPLSHVASFAIPNDAALAAISACAPLIECGAGTGYWTALLQHHGVDVLAYDSQPPSIAHNNGFFHGTYADVQRGDGRCLFDEEGGRELAARALLLIWPNNPDAYDNPECRSSHAAALPPVWDADCLASYVRAGGSTVIFVGEREEQVQVLTGAAPECGSSASRRFQTLLVEHFELTSCVTIPTWTFNADDLTVWKRRQPAATVIEATETAEDLAAVEKATGVAQAMASWAEADSVDEMLYAHEPASGADDSILPRHIREGRLDLFESGQSLGAAAEKLLGSQYIEASKTWVIADSARFTPADSAACPRRELECAPCFTSHVALAIPDNPPALTVRPLGSPPPRAGVTEVHRFEIAPHLAKLINETVLAEALPLYAEHVAAGGPGCQRSNVGGYHSEEETLDGTCSVAAIGTHSLLKNVVMEAIKTMRNDEKEEQLGLRENGPNAEPVEGGSHGAGHRAEGGEESGAVGRGGAGGHGSSMTWASVAATRVSGWLNVSAAHDFNALHDHGTAIYAAVYYVEAANDETEGMDEAESDPVFGGTDDAAEAACAGALLLKFQPVPWKHDFTWLAVRPRAGDLWIFPGYVPHAVLPRSYSRGPTPPSTSAAPPPSLRVSVACNIHADANSAKAEAKKNVLRRLLGDDAASQYS